MQRARRVSTNKRIARYERDGEVRYAVRCKRCGKRFNRSFASVDEANAYFSEHVRTEFHRNFERENQRRLWEASPEARLLAEIFGEDRGRQA